MSLNIYEGLSIDKMLQDGKYGRDKENHTAKYVEVSTVDDFIALKNHLALGDLPERFRQLDDVLKGSMNFEKIPLGKHILTRYLGHEHLFNVVDGTQTFLDILENLVVKNTNKQYRVITCVKYQKFSLNAQVLTKLFKVNTRANVVADDDEWDCARLDDNVFDGSIDLTDFDVFPTLESWNRHSEDDLESAKHRYIEVVNYLHSRTDSTVDTGFSEKDLDTYIPEAYAPKSDNLGLIWIYKSDDMNIPIGSINTCSAPSSKKIKIKGFKDYKYRGVYAYHDNSSNFGASPSVHSFGYTSKANTLNKMMRKTLTTFNSSEQMKAVENKMNMYYLRKLLSNYDNKLRDIKNDMVSDDNTIPVNVDDLVKEYAHMLQCGYTPASPKLQKTLEVYKSMYDEYCEVESYSTPLVLVTKIPRLGVGTPNDVDTYKLSYYNEMKLSTANAVDCEKVEMLTQDKMDESVLGKMAVLNFDFDDDECIKDRSVSYRYSHQRGFDVPHKDIKLGVGIKITENKWWIFTK